jgi:hypothetical protein
LKHRPSAIKALRNTERESGERKRKTKERIIVQINEDTKEINKEWKRRRQTKQRRTE